LCLLVVLAMLTPAYGGPAYYPPPIPKLALPKWPLPTKAELHPLPAERINDFSSDITIAKESAVFRQVGPMMGSFDAGFGTWYLEDLVGKKKAKEIWFRNPRLSAREALELGMINTVVPDAELAAATRAMALEIAERGAFALAAIKTAFSARHGGVGGLARLAHDMLLRPYLDSEESHELGDAFAARRTPDPDKFGH
jgi:naphthoate synthase